MTIKNEHLDIFYERFNTLAMEQLGTVDTEPKLDVTMPVSFEQLTPKLYQELRRFAPFGEGNPEPVFSLAAIIDDVRFVGAGEKHLKLKLKGEAGGKVLEAIAFNLGERFGDLIIGEKIEVAFTLEENTWNGMSTLQLRVIDIKRGG